MRPKRSRGAFIGARDGLSLRRCIRLCIVWCAVVSIVFVGVYIGWWRDILSMIVNPESGDIEQILTLAESYIGWIIAIPIAASMPFVMDGIMVGATRSRIMRDSMLLSTLGYFAIYFGLHSLIGNNALWCAFTMYMLLRGVLQWIMSHRLREIYSAANG